MKLIKLFPEIEEVFVDDLINYQKHFMPIATIDMSEVDENLKGLIHIIYFNNDPYCADARKYYNENCNNGKVSFDIIEDKYNFKTDLGYFNTTADWIRWLEMGKQSYHENKIKYYQEQHIQTSEVIKNFGRQPEWVQNNEWPTNKQGERLTFICQIWSGDFVSDYCEEEIFLFYDKINSVAVQVHQCD